MHGAPRPGNDMGEFVDVQPGQTVEIPAKIWDRYVGRSNVQAMDGVHIVIGGLKPGQHMQTPDAQEMANRTERKSLGDERAALDLLRERLEKKERDLRIEGVG